MKFVHTISNYLDKVSHLDEIYLPTYHTQKLACFRVADQNRIESQEMLASEFHKNLSIYCMHIHGYEEYYET